MRNKKAAINFTMSLDEKEEARAVRQDLGLPVSEFVRRSVRVAWPILTAPTIQAFTARPTKTE